MCLVALALDQNRRFPLVVATNRDEYYSRPTARLAWWTPANGGQAILGGRDLKDGGTWLGLTTAGRLGLVTNFRDPSRNDPSAPSRGSIVGNWLAQEEAPDRFWMRTALSGYNGFNLIAADFQRGECFWASNRAPYPLRLDRGVYGLSNALLDVAWPKVAALKESLTDALGEADSVDSLSVALLAALADRRPADDAELPDTGIPLDQEKALSAAFIRTPNGLYGTRCSTLVITERLQRGLITHVLERTYSATDGLALLRRSTLRNWPPRYDASQPGEEQVPAMQEAVHEAELPPDATAPPRKRSRVRSLLKPTGVHR